MKEYESLFVTSPWVLKCILAVANWKKNCIGNLIKTNKIIRRCHNSLIHAEHHRILNSHKTDPFRNEFHQLTEHEQFAGFANKRREATAALEIPEAWVSIRPN